MDRAVFEAALNPLSNPSLKPTRMLRAAYLIRYPAFYSCSFQPMNIQAPFTFASVHPLGVWRSLGLRLLVCASFKPFWPLALVQQALAALVFVVCGLCGHFRFCALGLTRRSSRPAYCGRLILFVRQYMIQPPTLIGRCSALPKASAAPKELAG